MKVHRNNVNFYSQHNSDFHTLASNVVQNIFQTDHADGSMYIAARFEPQPRTGWRVNNPASMLVTQPYAQKPSVAGQLATAGLGPYEQLLISCIAWGEYSTYVVVGDMGSGKSTTLRRVADALSHPTHRHCDACKKCEPLILFLDFNCGFSGRDPDHLLLTFKRRLYESLHKILRRAFRDNDLMVAFVEELEGDKLDGFDQFSRQVEGDAIWPSRSSRERTNALFAYIHSDTSFDVRLERIFELLGFVKRVLRPHAACIAVIYDNIDSLEPGAQYDVLLEIMRLQEFADVKSLVAMRRGTFVRLNNQAAYSFGVVNHAGPAVLDVLCARLDAYQANWNAEPALQGVPQHISEAVLARLRYLRQEMGHRGSIGELIAGVTGASVRLGLFATERAFFNVVIPYDRDPAHPNDLKRALLVGRSELGELSASDKLLANLFADSSTFAFSLIHIRVLQLLTVFNSTEGSRNIVTLVPQLKAIGGWKTTEIRRSLNYLLGMRRPLIWVDGKAAYDSNADMLGADDIVYLTSSGRSYLRRVVKDLVYFQECVTATEWPEDSMPAWADYSRISERFGVLRRALLQILRQDKTEVEQYLSWLSIGRRTAPGIRAELIGAAIARAVGQAFLSIAFSGETWRYADVREELQNWRSMLLDALNAGEALSKTRYNSLAQLCEDYKAQLTQAE